MSSSYPIVGMFYRPPAQVLINALPVGTALYLLAEPDNPFDSNAIAVWLPSGNIPEASWTKLEETLQPFGHNQDSILSQDEWHLGYIPKEMARALKQNGTVRDGHAIDVTFAVAPNGSPRIKFNEELT